MTPDLHKDVVTREGRRFRLRPVGFDDAPSLADMALHSTAEDLRLRFFTRVRPDLGPMAETLAHVDPLHHIAAAAYDPEEGHGDKEFYGVVRLVCPDDGPEAEFAVMVRSDVKGHGLGYCLMQEMLGWARDLGLRRVIGYVMSENQGMLHMSRDLGATSHRMRDDQMTLEVTFDLDAPGVNPT